MFLKGIVMNKKETIRRAYDGKLVTWEKLPMPDLVEGAEEIKNKGYYNPYRWVITNVKG